MPSARFEPEIPAIERPKTYVSDRTATEIGLFTTYRSVIAFVAL
jgi:hypothetical protein